MTRRRLLPLGLIGIGLSLLALGIHMGPDSIEGAYFSESVRARPSRLDVFAPDRGPFWAGAGAATTIVGIILALVWRRVR